MTKRRKVPFDNFSSPVQGFNVEGCDSSKTWLGFMVTLLLGALVAGVFISGLVSMFQRQSLVVSISEQGLPDPPPVNLKNLIVAFGVMNRATPLKSLVQGVDFNILAFMRTWKIFGEPKQIVATYEPVRIERCTEEYFGEMAESFKKVSNMGDIFCIPRDQSDDLFTVRGQLGSETFKDMFVNISCVLAPGASRCPASFLSSYIVIYYADSYMDPGNFSMPITRMPAGILDHADGISMHEKSLYVTTREIITDAGYFIADPKSHTDYVVNDYKTLVEAVNLLQPMVFSVNIQLNTKKITVNRQYNRILDVLATTTGIASTVAFVIGILFKPYVEMRAYNKVMGLLNPDKHVDITIRDYLLSCCGGREAKEKIKKVKADKMWIEKNMDLTHMIKNWEELDKLKKAPKTINMEESALGLENSTDRSAYNSRVISRQPSLVNVNGSYSDRSYYNSFIRQNSRQPSIVNLRKVHVGDA